MKEKQVLITTMGNTDYKKSDYYDYEYNYLNTSEYCVSSVLQWFKTEAKEIDTLVVLQTANEAVQKNVMNLSEQLAKSHPTLAVIILEINEDYQILEIASKVLDWLQKEQANHILTVYRIHSDISNGFRSFPMILQSVVRYLVTKNEHTKIGITFYVNTFKEIPEAKKIPESQKHGKDNKEYAGVLENLTLIGFVDDLTNGLIEYQKAKTVTILLTLKEKYSEVFNIYDKKSLESQKISKFFQLIEKTDNLRRAIDVNAVRSVTIEKAKNLYKAFEGAIVAFNSKKVDEKNAVIDLITVIVEAIEGDFGGYFQLIQNQQCQDHDDWQKYILNMQFMLMYHYRNNHVIQLSTIHQEYVISRMMYQYLLMYPEAEIMQPWDTDERSKYMGIFNIIKRYSKGEVINLLATIDSCKESIQEIGSGEYSRKIETDYLKWVLSILFTTDGEKKAILKMQDYRNKLAHADSSSENLKVTALHNDIEPMYESLEEELFIVIPEYCS